MSMSGTVSSTEIQPTRNCRENGLDTWIFSPSNGMNPSMSKLSASVTMSFISRSSSCMPFCTCRSVSALRRKRPSKTVLKCLTQPERATLAMLYSASHP